MHSTVCSHQSRGNHNNSTLKARFCRRIRFKQSRQYYVGCNRPHSSRWSIDEAIITSHWRGQSHDYSLFWWRAQEETTEREGIHSLDLRLHCSTDYPDCYLPGSHTFTKRPIKTWSSARSHRLDRATQGILDGSSRASQNKSHPARKEIQMSVTAPLRTVMATARVSLFNIIAVLLFQSRWPEKTIISEIAATTKGMDVTISSPTSWGCNRANLSAQKIQSSTKVNSGESCANHRENYLE